MDTDIGTTNATGHRTLGARGRLIGVVGMLVTVALVVPGVALATAPTVSRESFHRSFDFLECPAFTVWGSWDIDRSIVVWSDSASMPVRDHWHVEFRGVLFNPSTGTSISDRGVRDFLDDIGPDGSFVSTLFTYERTNAYVHEAGSTLFGPSDSNGDQPTLRQVGLDGFTEAKIATLCAALDS